MRDILGESPISFPTGRSAQTVSKETVEQWANSVNRNQTYHYDWHGHQEIIRRMAFELCQDVNNGTRDSLTFEFIHKTTAY